MADCWDYIIVGGGAAGCLLANRLSAVKGKQVLLLEAGPPDTDLSIRLPVGWASIAYGKKYNWPLKTVPQRELNNRQVIWPRGRVLGGSTSTNGMIYVRGQSQDFDDWANGGADGWDWASVVPYFKRFECSAIAGVTRGVDGELTPNTAAPSVWSDRFIEACGCAGFPTRQDYNAGEQFGAGYYEQTIARGHRVNAAKAFLQSARGRQNLTVKTGIHVNQLVARDGAVKGVSAVTSSGKALVFEGHHVVICAGAVHTPTILMRSGIGCGEHLSSLGIPVVLDQASVGANLQDHYGAMVACEVTGGGTVKDQLTPWGLMAELWRYLRKREGLLAMPSADAYLFHPSSQSEHGRPDTQVHFARASGERDDRGRSTVDKRPGVTAITYPMRPTSRGTLRLADASMAAPPLIDPNYLATDHDKQVLVDGLRTLRQVFASEPMANYVHSEIRPAVADSDSALLDYARATGTTGYHPVGTCRMGNDKDAVVDTQLRVRGIDGLTIADASIMPSLVSGNTMATTYMIAERAAEFLIAAQR